jgi:hypothetical protein
MTLDNVFRKLRAVGGTALTWSVAWGAAGIVPALLFVALFREGTATPVEIVRGTVVGFALAGLVAGTAFSLLLGTVYRRRRLADLRPRRVGLWGMAGAMGLAYVGLRAIATSGGDMAPPVGVAVLLLAGALGWATAAAGVRLAQTSGRVSAPTRREAALAEPAPERLGGQSRAAEPLRGERRKRQSIPRR